MKERLPIPNSQLAILTIRDKQVGLDSDLAKLYGVPSSAMNQAIKRKARRFPDDFSFLRNEGEFEALISQIVTSKGRGGRRKLPRVFTEHGAIIR
ncbi:MAG: ORF6N domain-containing protein [Verrucomicrobia bacterium]|nr:ORF6N domain-containing protein [Verrucomicrobiota bacterium]